MRASMGCSTDDSADMAKRLRHVKVRLGDVQPEKEVGHVAIGTFSRDEPIEHLVKGKLYA